MLVNLTRTVTSGSSVRLVLTFQKAGPITLLVPVFPRATHYQTYAPPQASASPSPSTTAKSRKHKAHASATPSASTSPTASPSPSPSA